MSNEFNNELPSEEQLLADLLRDFPNMFVRPLREYGAKGSTYGAWVGGESDCVMPDGLPVFIDIPCCDETYDGYVHVGFDKWLEDRGWYYEMESFGAYSIAPIVFAHGFCMIENRDYYIEEIRKHEKFLASRANVHWMRNYRKNHVDDGLPF